MNREEAIKHLGTYSTTLGSGQTAQAQHEEAKRIAIKALEQEPTKEEMALLQKWRDNRGISMEEFEDAMNTLDQGPCGNAIDRAEAIKVASGYCHPANVAKELAKLPAVNLQEPVYCDRNICIQNEYNGIGCEDCEVAKSQKLCEDTISRQAVLDLIVANHTELNGVNVVMYSPLYKDIKQLPPVTPQPKTGHWEQYGNFWEDKFKCSECGKEQPKILCGERIIGHWSDYCPNCGCRMVESQEREDKA